MSTEKQVSQLVTEHTPVVVLQTLAKLVYGEVTTPLVLFISGAEHSGKHTLARFVDVNASNGDTLILDPWHFPHGATELTTLNKHVQEWAPKAKVIQFTNIADKTVNADTIVQFAHDRNAHVVVYVNSLNAVSYLDESVMTSVLVANMSGVIDPETAENAIEARLVSEQKRAVTSLKEYHEQNSSIAQELFEQAKVRIVKYREPVVKTKKKR